jgi:AcrR family transcriptional regulator
MGRSGKRPSLTREQRRVKMASEVLAALGEEIYDGGFTDLTVEDLASAIGVSRATFYVYFQDKHDIAKAWLAEVSEVLVAGNRAWDSVPHDLTRSDLRAVIANLVEGYVPHAKVMAVVYDLALHDSGIREDIDRLIANLTQTMAKHIRAGQRAGFIDPELLPSETASWLTWMAEHTQQELKPSLGPEGMNRHIETYTDILWHTLYASAPNRRRDGHLTLAA